MSLPRRATLLSALAPLLLAGLIAGAWAVDHARLEGKVARNVVVAGVPIGTLSPDDASEALTTLQEEFPNTPVVITAEGIQLESTIGELGFAVDTEKTLADALSLGREGFSPIEVIRWLGSLTDTRRMPISLTSDPAKLKEAILRLEGEQRTKPTEPSLVLNGSGAVFTPGVVGREIDISSIEEQLPTSLDTVGGTIAVTAKRSEIKPKLSDEAVLAVKKQADDLLGSPIELVVGEKAEAISREHLLTVLSVDNSGGAPKLAASAEAAQLLADEFFPQRGNPTGVRFTMSNGAFIPQGGSDAVVCCSKDAGKTIAAELLKGAHKIEVPTRTMTAAEGIEWAKGLGVKEPVASFTTEHPCCVSRVTNIHRISDLTRGALIAPGATFSVNDFVGRRTAEKGFVSAGVIEDGEFKDDFGGGVSQFATTLFNAAFFGGYDIPDYKAHSVYISRYPFGREATLAYPHVDLKIRNDSPYGVVIWPTYTGSSVTVTLYSTKWATGQVSSGPTASETSDKVPKGCGTVKTVRKVIKLASGESSKDTFYAYYTCDPPEHP